ncbi:MAG: twin-arginine translocation signal domain-containing protein [Cellulomonas sp.]
MSHWSGRDALSRRDFLRAAGFGAVVLSLAGSDPLVRPDGDGYGGGG